jgi:hypothetical protein
VTYRSRLGARAVVGAGNMQANFINLLNRNTVSIYLTSRCTKVVPQLVVCV